MSIRAAFYRNKSRAEVRNMRSDLAAKQYAGRNGFDAIKVDGDRHYMLTQSDGRHWHGPWTEEAWLYQYMGFKKPLSHFSRS